MVPKEKLEEYIATISARRLRLGSVELILIDSLDFQPSKI